MWIRNVEVAESPLIRGHLRLQAEVLCRDKTVAPEIYWIDLPADVAPLEAPRGNFWLTLLAPLAVNLGEPLVLRDPVDAGLLANIRELMEVWRCWYPARRPIAIEADAAAAAPRFAGGRTAAMFSGGVDAWYTLLESNGRGAAAPRGVDELLCVWGLDVLISRPDQYRVMRDLLAAATAGFGARLIEVATNIRETQWWHRADWGLMAHGPALAATAHAFGDRYARLLIPSSHRYDDLSPWGSHPLTDPLLSSSRLNIVHHGATASRVEKIVRLAEDDSALASLQVCWETGTYENCGHCVKCYRTMATLDLVGRLAACPRLPGATYDSQRLGRLLSRTESERILMRELRGLAKATGREDVVSAVTRSLVLSRFAAKGLKAASFCAQTPALWRLRDPLEQAIFRHMMT